MKTNLLLLALAAIIFAACGPTEPILKEPDKPHIDFKPCESKFIFTLLHKAVVEPPNNEEVGVYDCICELPITKADLPEAICSSLHNAKRIYENMRYSKHISIFFHIAMPSNSRMKTALFYIEIDSQKGTYEVVENSLANYYHLYE